MFFDFLYALTGGWCQWGEDFGYFLMDVVALLFGDAAAERWFS